MKTGNYVPGSEHYSKQKALTDAAPDFMAIVQSFVRLHDCGIVPQVVRGMHNEEHEWFATIAKARAAIAKVKGAA